MTCNQEGYDEAVNVTMCLYAPRSNTQTTRLLMSTQNTQESLQYALYYDPALTQKIEDQTDVQCNSIVIAKDQKSTTTTIPIYGNILLNQSLNSGLYQDLVVPLKLRYKFQRNNVPSRDSVLSSRYLSESSLAVTANYENSCNLTTVPDLNFGEMHNLYERHLGATVLSFSCPSNTSWRISLDQGLHANGNTRRMHQSGYYINYQLYQDSARTVVWGNDYYGQQVNQNGTQRISIYGEVPSQHTILPAGEYTDTVTVKITY